MEGDTEQETQHRDWRKQLYWNSKPLRSGQGNIRLLTIRPRGYTLPGAPPNTIHCTLHLESLKNGREFTAVSHAWDESDATDATKSVWVNGIAVPVSRDLYGVLRHGQEAEGGPDRLVWVDALCVNVLDAEEKSAQRAQLAGVFGAPHARTLVWLGAAADDSDEAMDALRQLAVDQYSHSSSLAGWTYASSQALVAGGQTLLRNVMPASASTSTTAPEQPPPQQQQQQQETRPRSRPKKDEEAYLKDQLVNLRRPLKALLSRPYWTRLWSVPELALSSRGYVACGNHGVELGAFSAAVQALDGIINESTFAQWLKTSSSSSPSSSSPTTTPSSLDQTQPSDFARSPALRLLAHRDFFRRDRDAWIPAAIPLAAGAGKASGPPLLDLLTRFHVPGPAGETPALQARDPRDRVFALLPLAGDAAALGLAPDYAKDARGVFTESSIALLRQSPRLLQLAASSSSSSSPPSWLVSWASLARPLSDDLAQHPFGACGPADARFYRASTDPGLPGGTQVALRGARVDRVREAGMPHAAAGESGTAAYLGELRRLWDVAVALGAAYAPEQLEVALAKTAVADAELVRGSSGQQQQQQPGRRWTRAATKSVRAFEALSNPDATDEEKTTPDVEDYQAALARTVGLRPFLTKKGYIGLGPQGLAEGDDVVIPYASPVPFALRRSDESAEGEGEEKGEGTYSLVGEIYVFGIMDGEFMRVHRKETLLRLV
ncbi:heterokaryon incompatibility protein-domain-containing protein [Xylariomycetidae sp. FL0641]|nr:heterokaryon incompatibility protein-domain-containing protein [Xylariomycetidae sp. FL0641]